MTAVAAPRVVWEYRSETFRRQTPAAALAWLALASAGLQWLSHFPVGWGFLGWVSLVPLLAVVRLAESGKAAFGYGWLAGVAFFMPALQWLRVADPRMYATWLALALYCSTYVGLAVWLVRWLDRRCRLPLVMAVPAVWVGLEYLRSWLLGGFAWYFLAHTQHTQLWLLQVADFAGAYGVSFLVAAVNAAIFDTWWYLRHRRARVRGYAPPGPPGWLAAIEFAVVLALIGGAAWYGSRRLGEEHFTAGPRLALLQGNLDQKVKNAASEAEEEKAVHQVLDHYSGLCDVAAGQSPRPELIVWPETSFPFEWEESPAGTLTADSRRIANWAGRWRQTLLLGLNSQVADPGGARYRYNSALLLGPRGEVQGRYDKVHRVPFGEFVPFREWLPWMDRFAPYDFDYSIRAGAGLTRLPLGKYTFGVLICYEDTDPLLAREYAEAGVQSAPADFLLNTSNDGWFDGTSEHDEHLAICRFRAVESRKPIARSVNMGISAVVDGSGRVVAASEQRAAGGPEGSMLWETADVQPSGGPALPTRSWHEFKKIPGVLLATIPLDDRPSYYARVGDWLPLACWFLIGTCLAGRGIARLRHRRLA